MQKVPKGAQRGGIAASNIQIGSGQSTCKEERNNRRNRKKTKDENRKAERHGKSGQKGKDDFFSTSYKLSFSNEQGTHDCCTQKDIAAVCIVENKKRFSQSRSTPSMKASLIGRVGYNAEKEAGQQILDGPDI